MDMCHLLIVCTLFKWYYISWMKINRWLPTVCLRLLSFCFFVQMYLYHSVNVLFPIYIHMDCSIQQGHIVRSETETVWYQ